MPSVEKKILAILSSEVSAITATSVLNLSRTRARVDLAKLDRDAAARLVRDIERGLGAFIPNPQRVAECVRRIEAALAPSGGPIRRTSRPAPANARDLVPIKTEIDILTARSIGRNMARGMGFSAVMQVKIATAISELARNIVHYAGTGEVEIAALATKPPGLEVVARDKGPGIADLDLVLNGRYESKRGMGMGLRGTRNLVDKFDVVTGPGKGTQVTIRVFVK